MTLPPAWVTPHWVPPPVDGESRYKRKRDGWYPFLGSQITRFYRKRRRLAMRLRRTRFAEHTMRDAVDGGWQGFPGDIAESIKASYADRSYLGAPEYCCRNSGAIVWVPLCLKKVIQQALFKEGTNQSLLSYIFMTPQMRSIIE